MVSVQFLFQAMFTMQKTRATRSFHPKRFKNLYSSSNTYKYSFFATTVKEWNTLPDHLIEQQTVNSFVCRGRLPEPQPRLNNLFFFSPAFALTLHYNFNS